MPKFGSKSLKELNTCNKDIQVVLKEVIKCFDFSILSGRRTKEEQKKLYDANKTKTLESKHLVGDAVDIAPYPINFEDVERFIYLAGWIKGIASSKGVPIIWGGDWNNNTEINDTNFRDLGHFELRYE